MEEWFSDGRNEQDGLLLTGLARIVSVDPAAEAITLEQLHGPNLVSPHQYVMSDPELPDPERFRGLLVNAGEEDYPKLSDYFVLTFHSGRGMPIFGRTSDMTFRFPDKTDVGKSDEAVVLLSALLGKPITYNSLNDQKSIGTIAEVVRTADEGIRVVVVGKNLKDSSAIDRVEIYISEDLILDLSCKHPHLAHGRVNQKRALSENTPARREGDPEQFRRYQAILASVPYNIG